MIQPFDATAASYCAPPELRRLVARIDAGIAAHPWLPSWVWGDDGAQVRDEYTAGHEPYHYLDACRRRDVRESIRARAAAWLRATRLLERAT